MRAPRIAFDIMLLAFYLVTANPATTGMPLHEYLGVGVFVLMVAHVVMSGEGLCVVSGIMVSGALLPSLGLYATGYYFWDPVHALSAKVLLAALLVHIVLRIPVVMSVFRRHSSNSFAR